MFSISREAYVLLFFFPLLILCSSLPEKEERNPLKTRKYSSHSLTRYEQCYAKCIGLTAEKEPDIFNAIRYGSVLENVVFDPDTRIVDYDDVTLTENTRW